MLSFPILSLYLLSHVLTVRAQATVQDSNIAPIIPNGGSSVNQNVGGIPITYHGGQVLTSPVSVYFIWYGNWAQNNDNNALAVSILTDLATSIGGSAYFAINQAYTQGTGGPHVTSSVTYGGSCYDQYSQGTSISTSTIFMIVNYALTSSTCTRQDHGPIPVSANAVYFVFTSSDVSVTGFCTSFCGYHTYGTVLSTTIKYSFIGNAARCLNACAKQTTSPNGNAGADAMASIFAHELSESVTDPLLNAWYDARGNENADKCAWTFGATTTVSGKGMYNVHIGSRNYLIQQNWKLTGVCGLS